MHILIADDDTAFAEALSTLVTELDGVSLVTIAHTGTSALKAVDELEEINAAILDIAMPGASGIQVLKKLRERSPYAVIIILTGTDEVDAEKTALDNGADLFLSKSEYVEQLSEAIAVAERRQSWPKARVRKF